MKKFSKLIVAGKTRVQLAGEYGYRVVEEINENRNLIKVNGLHGSFQRKHILKFTNKTNAEMYPAIDDLYFTNPYGSVFKYGNRTNFFVGKLNGRTLKQFLADKEQREMFQGGGEWIRKATISAHNAQQRGLVLRSLSLNTTKHTSTTQKAWNQQRLVLVAKSSRSKRK